MGPPAKKRNRNRKRKRRIASDSSDSSDSEESSSSSSSSSTPEQTATVPAPESTETSSSSDDESVSSNHEPPLQRDSPSPRPLVDIPPFMPPNTPESERALKEKFRKFWMASIAEGFKDDLEEIRKEPNLGPSRLALLIDSLASGADVFSSSSAGGSANEMEVVLDQLS